MYDSSFDQRLYVGGRGTFGGLTAVELEERLGELCVVVPGAMLSAVLAEEAGGGGSFVKRW